MSERRPHLSCSSRFIKLLIVLINFITWVAGCFLLALGIWFYVGTGSIPILQFDSISNYASLLRAASAIIIVVGTVIIIISSLGCCAAYHESSDSLLVFSTVLAFLLIGQLASGILAGVYRNKLMTDLVDVFSATLQSDYGNANRTAETNAWNFAQIQFQCCGLSGPLDWLNSSSWSRMIYANGSGPVPKSCCVLTNDQWDNPLPLNETACYADVRASQSSYIYLQGCKSSVELWVRNHFSTLIGIAIGFMLIQVLGIVMACILCHDVRNQGIIN